MPKYKPMTYVYFDPENKDHVKLFADFLYNRRWQQPCPFLLEEPFLDIPSMCKEKLLQHLLIEYK